MRIAFRSTQGDIYRISTRPDETLESVTLKLSRRVQLVPETIYFSFPGKLFDNSTKIKELLPNDDSYILFCADKLENKDPNHLQFSNFTNDTDDDDNEEDRKMKPIAAKASDASDYVEDDFVFPIKEAFVSDHTSDDDFVLPEIESGPLHEPELDELTKLAMILVEYGFDFEMSRSALLASNLDFDEAVNILRRGYIYDVPTNRDYGSQSELYNSLTLIEQAAVNEANDLLGDPEEAMKIYIEQGKNLEATKKFILNKLNIPEM
jgi:hypothetical protein